MKRMSVVLMLVGALVAPQVQAEQAKISRVMDVIEAAAAAEGEPVRATIEIEVKAFGREGSVLFLNSEKDYRDPRNISLDLQPTSLPDLRHRFGEPFPESIVGQRVRVTGNARRTTIWFHCRGMTTTKFYYQTHLAVTEGVQLQRVF